MIKIDCNAEEVLKELRRLGPSVVKAVRRGVLSAAERYTEDIHNWIDQGKSFTPRTGELQQSIDWRHEGKAEAVVFAQAEYAPYIEFGTRGPYVIRPKERKALKIPVEDRGYILRKKVVHPGISAKPFFFADFENRKKRALEAFKKAILEALKG